MNIKNLIAEVRAHDVSANPGPWDLAWPTCITTGGQHGDTIADGCPEDDAALIAHYRTAAPLLADEVERLESERDEMLRVLNYFAADRRGERREEFLPETSGGNVALDLLATICAENATLRAQVDEAKTRADNAYAEGLADGQTAAERECDADPEPDPEKVAAFKAEMECVCAQFEETRLTLLSEQGKPEGAVSDRWRVSYNRRGFEWWRGEDDELPEVECHLSGGEWRWTKPGFESNPYPTARECMIAADKDSP